MERKFASTGNSNTCTVALQVYMYRNAYMYRCMYVCTFMYHTFMYTYCTPHLDSHKHPRTDGGVHATTQLLYSLLLPQP